MRWSLIFIAALFTATASAAQFAPRIIGGQAAVVGAWPATVQIMKLQEGSEDEFGFACGASLVNPYWALTAAHCVFEEAPQNLRLLSKSNGILAAGNEHMVSEYYIHPNYAFPSDDFDIALILLEQPATDSALIKLYNGDPAAGCSATAVGWGVSSTAPNAGAEPRLREVSLPIVSQSECKRAMGRKVTDNMVCAGSGLGTKDTCQGDSGGPLIMLQNGEYRQVGITSWGADPCASKNTYGVYTRLSRFSDWIDETIGESDATVLGGSAAVCGVEETRGAGGFGVPMLLGLVALLWWRRQETR